VRQGDRELTGHAITKVTFRDFDPAWYVSTGEWRGRAGAYAIQGKGTLLVERIEGDYWNVVGLPLAELVRLAPNLLISGQWTVHSGQGFGSGGRGPLQ
jgi:septum formation protein